MTWRFSKKLVWRKCLFSQVFIGSFVWRPRKIDKCEKLEFMKNGGEVIAGGPNLASDFIRYIIDKVLKKIRAQNFDLFFSYFWD